MELNFGIEDWAGWIPGASNEEQWRIWANSQETFQSLVETQEQPNVKVIPPMLRRRLSPMGRAAASVMLPLFATHGAMPIVYISRHGEVAKTLEMLTHLAQETPLSPAAFSLSVHNALAGLLSIQQKSDAAITAIAAGKNDLAPALIEAIGQLSSETPKVLCIFCDTPVPGFYQSQLPPSVMFAAAFVISDQFQYQLVANPTDQGSDTLGMQPQALQLLKSLLLEESSLQIDNWKIVSQ
ncbi:MAG: beta-ketoacyl synthase chain length factor [Cellvibrionaceae bacterium]